MEDKLTPFQLWSLIKLYDLNQPMPSTELVRNCCESALMTLDENNVDKELLYLVNTKYLKIHGSQCDITTKGIVVIRKILSKIQDACNQDKISKEIIEKQDKELQKAIKDRVGDLLPTIIKCAINNIGPIMELLIKPA